MNLGYGQAHSLRMRTLTILNRSVITITYHLSGSLRTQCIMLSILSCVFVIASKNSIFVNDAKCDLVNPISNIEYINQIIFVMKTCFKIVCKDRLDIDIATSVKR